MPPSLSGRLIAGSVAACVVAATAALLPPSASAAEPTSPFISELHYDNGGVDTGEFVEVQLPAGTSTAGLSLVLYNGDTGKVYRTITTLPAPAADQPGVVAVDAVGLQNGSPDGVVLLSGSTVLDALAYEGSFTATDGPAAGTTLPDIGVGEAGTEAAGLSLARFTDVSSPSGYVWRGPATATRGALNAGTGSTPPPTTPPPAADPCAATDLVTIGAVQGSGPATSRAGETLTVRGTVVGDEPGLRGYYLQDSGDGDLATSDGIFVFSPLPVELGDTVAVTGKPSEFEGQTQLTPVSSAAGVCTPGTAAALPAPAELDLPAGDAARERLEGMLVAPVDTLTVSEVYDLTSFGELTLSQGGVLVTPTELADPQEPGAVAAAQAANLARALVLDDGVSARVSTTTRPYLSPTTPVRVGDRLTFTAPTVLGFGFGVWRLQPADGTAAGTFQPTNSRTPAPARVGGDLQVGSFNVLNYFLTFDQSIGRGAKDQAGLDRQAGKIVPAISALHAEVVTLLEIEDTDSTGLTPGNPDTALADLVRRLNVAAGYDKWSYVPMPKELLAVDRDVIRNGIIYVRDAVQPVGAPVGLVDETVWANAREPIAQTFAKDGDRFTVVANHFKSKGSGTGGDNADVGDGQGASNGDRVRQAQSLVTFTDRLRASSGDPDVLLLGDLNAYSEEAPIDVLRQAGFTDLGVTLDPGRYSYVFDDASGSLDHALASPSLTRKVTDLTHWNINSVESFAYEYDGDPALYAADPYRSSDHDPVVLGINLTERCAGEVPTIRGTKGADVLRGTKGPDVILGLGGNDTIDGLQGDDVVCGGAGDDRILGGNGDDTLLGGFGDDSLSGGNGDDRLIGGPGSDTLDQDRGEGPERQGGAEG